MCKLMKYAKQYTWQSIICPILMVGEVVLELMLPYYMSYIIDVGIPNGDRKYIIEIGVKMVAMAFGLAFLRCHRGKACVCCEYGLRHKSPHSYV